MKRKLNQIGMEDDRISQICKDFLGSERNEIRIAGLVDQEDVALFELQYDQMKNVLPGEFVDWLETPRGRNRSLVEAMKLCMLRSVRIAAGLGNPPNKWVNNTTESLHAVIKEELKNNSLDVCTFLERVKATVFQQQMDELIRGIYGMGEYRLVDSKANLAVTPITWSEMTPEQRKRLTRKVFNVALRPGLSPGDYKLSVPLMEWNDLISLPLYTLKNIWSTTEFILSNYKLQQLFGGNICVPDVDAAFTVEIGPSYALKCHCQLFRRTNGLCHHAVAVAEKGSYLRQFLERFAKKCNDPNRVIHNNIPSHAGDKPKQKKPRRGRNNIQMMPITSTVNDNLPSNNYDPDIDIPKQQRFTEFFHNNERFEIVMLKDNECKRAKSCISCKIAFAKDNPVSPEGDIIIIHKERYERPVKDHNGNFLRMTVSNHLGRKFYCLKKDCLLRRHPYFWKGMLKVNERTRAELKSAHINFIAYELHLHL